VEKKLIKPLGKHKKTRKKYEKNCCSLFSNYLSLCCPILVVPDKAIDNGQG
jgi:hypothetical protein